MTPRIHSGDDSPSQRRAAEAGDLRRQSTNDYTKSYTNSDTEQAGNYLAEFDALVAALARKMCVNRRYGR